MATYTVGEIRRVYISDETTYATSTTADLSYTGEVVSLKPNTNFNVEYHYISGSRAFLESTRGPYDVSFTYRAFIRANSTSPSWNWVDFWAYYAFGTTSGTADHLDTFTALAGKTVSTSNYYNLYNGCKFNQLTITSDGPGKPIFFEGDIWAQYVEYDTDKTFALHQSVTVGADPDLPTTDPVIWNGNCKINIAAGGETTIYPSKWSLSVSNELGREYGVVTGPIDGIKRPVAVALTEGKRTITVEMTLPHKDETYTNAKIAGSAITSFTIPVDNRTITLSNGVLEANDFPELKQDKLEETVTMRFESMSIA